MENNLCSKCGRSEVLNDLRVVDRTLEEDWMAAAADLKVEVETKPAARVFKGIVGFPLSARVCGSCGFAELFVANPKKLVEAVKEREHGNVQ